MAIHRCDPSAQHRGGNFECRVLVYKQNSNTQIMKMKTGWMSAMLLSCALIGFTSCNDDNDADAGKGTAQFEITDAPSDDANIKSVFVTVADIQVDGKSIEGYTKQTIDLKAYQKGSTKVLGTTDLSAKTYGKVTLVLDVDADQSGSAPGSYVLTQDGQKFKLTNSSATSGQVKVDLTKDWEVKNGVTSNVVFDFDLRKSLVYSGTETERYRFATTAGLQSAIRVVAKENTATIKGTYTEQISSGADAVIVYAYKKGSFNASTETTIQGENNLTFSNAVASAKVETALSGNTYTLAFVEKGEYELHFVAYTKDVATNRFNFKSLLQADTMINGSVTTSFNLNAGADLSVSATIKGLITN